MGWETEIDDVVAGEPVESVWGNEIRDKLVHIVATLAALPSDVAQGGLAYVEADDLLRIFDGTSWGPVAGGGVLGYASTATQQTGIGSAATDVTSATVTVTVPAGRRLRISGGCRLSQVSATGSVNLNLVKAGSPFQTLFTGALSASALAMAHGVGFDAPAAGSHTFKLQGQTSAGTLTIAANASIPTYIAVEDVGRA
jgi:hypothetical protein